MMSLWHLAKILIICDENFGPKYMKTAVLRMFLVLLSEIKTGKPDANGAFVRAYFCEDNIIENYMNINANTDRQLAFCELKCDLCEKSVRFTDLIKFIRRTMLELEGDDAFDRGERRVACAERLIYSFSKDLLLFSLGFSDSETACLIKQYYTANQTVDACGSDIKSQFKFKIMNHLLGDLLLNLTVDDKEVPASFNFLYLQSRKMAAKNRSPGRATGQIEYLRKLLRKQEFAPPVVKDFICSQILLLFDSFHNDAGIYKCILNVVFNMMDSIEDARNPAIVYIFSHLRLCVPIFSWSREALLIDKIVNSENLEDNELSEYCNLLGFNRPNFLSAFTYSVVNKMLRMFLRSDQGLKASYNEENRQMLETIFSRFKKAISLVIDGLMRLDLKVNIEQASGLFNTVNKEPTLAELMPKMSAWMRSVFRKHDFTEGIQDTGANYALNDREIVYYYLGAFSTIRRPGTVVEDYFDALNNTRRISDKMFLTYGLLQSQRFKNVREGVLVEKLKKKNSRRECYAVPFMTGYAYFIAREIELSSPDATAHIERYAHYLKLFEERIHNLNDRSVEECNFYAVHKYVIDFIAGSIGENRRNEIFRGIHVGFSSMKTLSLAVHSVIKLIMKLNGTRTEMLLSAALKIILGEHQRAIHSPMSRVLERAIREMIIEGMEPVEICEKYVADNVRYAETITLIYFFQYFVRAFYHNFEKFVRGCRSIDYNSLANIGDGLSLKISKIAVSFRASNKEAIEAMQDPLDCKKFVYNFAKAFESTYKSAEAPIGFCRLNNSCRSNIIHVLKDITDAYRSATKREDLTDLKIFQTICPIDEVRKPRLESHMK